MTNLLIDKILIINLYSKVIEVNIKIPLLSSPIGRNANRIFLSRNTQ